MLLAQQAEAIDADSKKQILSLVLGLGAATSVICNPVFGAFSDRTTLRAGRRLPWIVAGALGGALSLVVLSAADNVIVMALGGAASRRRSTRCSRRSPRPSRTRCRSAPRQGRRHPRDRPDGRRRRRHRHRVGDRQHRRRLPGHRGLPAGPDHPLLPGLPRHPLAPDEQPAPFDWGAFLRSFWVSPRAHPDFAWAWLTRFLVNLGNALGLLYLLYYMQDVIGFDKDEAADRVLILTATYAAVLMATAVTFGIWSDRSGKRKVFVIWSGVVGGCASLLLAVGQTWPTAVVAAVLMGFGYGIYTSVDFALITQVLPGADDRGKDLGVINIANALPQVFAPGIAAVILIVVEALRRRHRDQRRRVLRGLTRILYGSAFAAAILGSIFVTRIKSVPSVG